MPFKIRCKGGNIPALRKGRQYELIVQELSEMEAKISILKGHDIIEEISIIELDMRKLLPRGIFRKTIIIRTRDGRYLKLSSEMLEELYETIYRARRRIEESIMRRCKEIITSIDDTLDNINAEIKNIESETIADRDISVIEDIVKKLLENITSLDKSEKDNITIREKLGKIELIANKDALIKKLEEQKWEIIRLKEEILQYLHRIQEYAFSHISKELEDISKELKDIESFVKGV